MSSNIFLRFIRLLLFPIALLYGLIIKLRNWLYNKKYFKSVAFNLPVINVGNLSVGGTGKSPMVEFLIKQLQDENNLAILSRGYGRKTKGYILASKNSTASEIGDEPFMYYQQFPQVKVAVGEERILAVPKLLQDAADINVIILDDAFQHRAIQPSINIVLTDYSNLYSNDYFLPTGNLRDERNSAKRANIIIVTKCPLGLNVEEKLSIEKKLQIKKEQPLFFSTIEYTALKSIISDHTINLNNTFSVLLVTGIANPKPIENLLLDKNIKFKKITFADHHNFKLEDIKKIESTFSALTTANKIIITTQKDAVRLINFKEKISDLPIYILPLEIKFLFSEEAKFVKIIKNHIKSFKY